MGLDTALPSEYNQIRDEQAMRVHEIARLRADLERHQKAFDGGDTGRVRVACINQSKADLRTFYGIEA